MTLQKFKGCYKGFEGDINSEAFQMRQKFMGMSKILEFHRHVCQSWQNFRNLNSELAETQRNFKVFRILEACQNNRISQTCTSWQNFRGHL